MSRHELLEAVLVLRDPQVLALFVVGAALRFGLVEVRVGIGRRAASNSPGCLQRRDVIDLCFDFELYYHTVVGSGEELKMAALTV